jgi:hypothetical protein
MLHRWGVWMVVVLVGCSSTGKGLQDGTGGTAGAGLGGSLGLAGGGPGGTAGTAGSGVGGFAGVGGETVPGTGRGGTAGGNGLPHAACADESPPCPTCSDVGAPLPVIQFCAKSEADASSSGTYWIERYNGPATIASVDEVPGGACYGGGTTPPTEPMNRIVLQIPDRSPVTVYLQIPNLPAGRFTAGASVDVDVDGRGAQFFQRSSQQIILSRAGKVLAFAAATGGDTAGLRVPVTLTLGGEYVCQPAPCAFTRRSMGVSAGGSEAVLLPGQTAQLGTMSVTFGRFESFITDGRCDPSAVSYLDIAGFDISAD